MGVSLRQFARELDVSASFLSQLETGKAQPSVATLYSICGALNLSVDDLFADEQAIVEPGRAPANSSHVSAAFSQTRHGQVEDEKSHEGWHSPSRSFEGPRSPVVTRADRKVITLDSGVSWERLTATTGKESNFLFVRYEVGGSSSTDGNLLRHMGTEYWYVLCGVLEVVLGFETYRLNEGDAISFDSRTPHRMTNPGDVAAEAIWFDLDHDITVTI
jgi:mannose-6-phosphate isomerase-like protein (cupin superfamily)